jgi:hypothetical protein
MARRRTMLSADGEVVWFWHPLLVLNSRRLVGPTGLRQPFNPRMTVTRRIRRRGEHEGNRKTIARGMPGDFGCDRGDYARVLHLISHMRLRVHWAPGIPCALYSRGTLSYKSRAHRAAGMRVVCGVDVIARSKATKQSIVTAALAVECFAEPVIGRTFARPVGSQ